MKIEVNVRKRHFWIFLGLIVIGLIGTLVHAYNQQIPNPGHGADVILVTVNGQEMTLQEAVSAGSLGQGGAEQTATVYIGVDNDDNAAPDCWTVSGGTPPLVCGDRAWDFSTHSAQTCVDALRDYFNTLPQADGTVGGWTVNSFADTGESSPCLDATSDKVEVQLTRASTGWQSGSYCLMQGYNAACPLGFTQGYMCIDSEDNNNWDYQSGNIGASYVGGSCGGVSLYFCCK